MLNVIEMLKIGLFQVPRRKGEWIIVENHNYSSTTSQKCIFMETPLPVNHNSIQRTRKRFKEEKARKRKITPLFFYQAEI